MATFFHKSTNILKFAHIKNFASRTSLQDFPALPQWRQSDPQKAGEKGWSRAGFGCLAGRGEEMKVLPTRWDSSDSSWPLMIPQCRKLSSLNLLLQETDPGCSMQKIRRQASVGLLFSPPSNGGTEVSAAVSRPTPTTIPLWGKLMVLEARVVLVALACLVTQDLLSALLAQLGLGVLVCLEFPDFLVAQQVQPDQVHHLAREAPRRPLGLPALWHQTVRSFPCCL